MARLLAVEDISSLVSRMWRLRLDEQGDFDRIHDFTRGTLGKPSLPVDADEEIKNIRDICVKNVLSLVRDVFVQNLSVVGYKRATSRENLPGWANWQRNRMDARQAEIYRPAVEYGASYVPVVPGPEGPMFRPRSPRQLLAIYDDPQTDEWPECALETWIDYNDAKPRRKGLLYDDELLYPLDLGELATPVQDGDGQIRRITLSISQNGVGTPIPHSAGVCPVVRYINARDAEDMIVGEIEPLITLQKAINEVNFDRLIFARWGAFPQTVLSGWAGSKDQVVEASARRVWTFADDVKATRLAAGGTTPYNEMLNEMLEHVAMVAQISPAYVTGKLINLSAEALAAAEANQQRKLAAKRDSFGESHEQLLRVAARMSGDTETADDTEAEVVWRDTEARSFAAVVDGVVKLAHAGVPIEAMLSMIPGMTQQQQLGVQEAMRTGRMNQILDKLTAVNTEADGGISPGAPVPAEPDITTS